MDTAFRTVRVVDGMFSCLYYGKTTHSAFLPVAPSFDSFVDAAPSFVDSIPESHHVQHHLSPPREAVFRDDPRFGSEENRYPLPRFP